MNLENLRSYNIELCSIITAYLRKNESQTKYFQPYVDDLRGMRSSGKVTEENFKQHEQLIHAVVRELNQYINK